MAIGAQTKNTITVSSTEEFIKALNDNTEIIIQSDTIDLTTEKLEKLLGGQVAFDYQPTPKSCFVSSEGFVLYGYEDLTIRAERPVDLISDNDFDDILIFDHCSTIRLENLSVFHTNETCNGSVVSIMFSDRIHIRSCAFNGSGGIGMNIIGSKDISVEDSQIFNNVFHAVYAINAHQIRFYDTHIYGNHDWGDALIHTEAAAVQFFDCIIENNSAPRLCNQPYWDYSPDFVPAFTRCDIANNDTDYTVPEQAQETTPKSYHRQYAMLQTFLEILRDEADSDYDARLPELLSFFEEDTARLSGNAMSRTDFSEWYDTLKQSKDYPELEVQSITPTDPNRFTVKLHIRGRNHVSDQEPDKVIWNYTFNKKDQILHIEEIAPQE